MMLARNSKRLLAMLMAIVMCLGLVSTSALAAVDTPKGEYEGMGLFEYHITRSALEAMVANETDYSYDDIHGATLIFEEGDRDLVWNGVPEIYWTSISGLADKNPSDLVGLRLRLDNGNTQKYLEFGEDQIQAVYYQILGVDFYEIELKEGSEPEPEQQKVYVYVDAADATGDDGVVNEHEYYTIGEIELSIPAATEADKDGGADRYITYSDEIAAALNSISRYEPNEWLDLNDVEWYTLHADNGADDYVNDGTFVWHLDGKIKGEAETYTVTYHSNGGIGEVPVDNHAYLAGEPITPASGDGLTKGGYEFAGWSTDEKATKPDETFAIPAEGGNVTLYAVWTPKAEPQEGMLRVTKVMELPEGMKLPEDYQVTLTVTEDGTKIGEKTFGYYQLVNGSASFDIYGVEPGEHTYYVDEVVRSSAVEIPSGKLVVDGVAYELKSSGTGYQTTEVVANQVNTALVVTNTYTKNETQPPVEGPVLTVTKTASASSVEAGGNVTYTIEVKNTGNETAKNVRMTDTLPAGLEYVSHEVVSGKNSVVTRGNDVTWQLDDLEPGADVVLKLTVKVSSDAAAGTVTNTAVATADNAEKVSGSASFEVKGSTDPDPTPTPTNINPPYEPDDGDDDNDVVIVDPTTPLDPGPSTEPTTEPTAEPSEEPGVEIPEETTPLAPDPGDGDDANVDITDGETPLGNLPQTGAVAAPVNPATTAGLVALAFSMAGCGLYFTFGRKKGEEED